MPTQDTWRFFNSFADWLSGLGTLAAVWVALHLARRDDSVRLRISGGIWHLFQRGVSDWREEVVNVNITNIGRRPATVTHVWWEVGLVRKVKYLWVIGDTSLFGVKLPVKLEDGEEATIGFPLKQFDGNIAKWVSDSRLTGLLGCLRRRRIRVCASTTANCTFRRVINKDLRDRVKDLARKAAQKKT